MSNEAQGKQAAEAKAPREVRADEGGGKRAATHAGGVWEQVRTLVVAGLIALAIRAFVVEPFRIPSGSMLPTLLIGDHLFVNKFVYGIKFPFTGVRLPGLRDPEPGDVVVFTVAKLGGKTFPADREPDLPREEFVKRIVGVPGDTVEVRDGIVRVNGEVMATQRLGEAFRDDAGYELDVYEVDLESRSYRILDDRRSSGPEVRRLHVEPGRYFMLGDNRDHSKDSRIWGTVRLAEIKGPAFVLYWSWNFNGGWLPLANPFTWWDLLTLEMRWDRIGSWVE